MKTVLKNADGVRLPHSMMVELRNKGMLNLGIRDDLAERITQVRGLGPQKTTAVVAFKFWNLIGFGVLGYTIYLSVTASWWWFIVGFLGAGMIFNANKRGNSENFLDAAMVDEQFYDRVLRLDGWMYQVKVEDVDAVKKESL